MVLVFLNMKYNVSSLKYDSLKHKVTEKWVLNRNDVGSPLYAMNMFYYHCLIKKVALIYDREEYS